MVAKGQYDVDAWQLVLWDTPRPTSLYTLYYSEGQGLELDTPAMDINGVFLWCTSVNKLKTLWEKTNPVLAKRGMATKTEGLTISLRTDMHGIYVNNRDMRKWNRTIFLLNTIIDYSVFLPESLSISKKVIDRFGKLSDHMLMEDTLDDFFEASDVSRDQIVDDIAVAMMRIFRNSIIL